MNLSWFYLYFQKLLKIRTSGGGFENSDTPGQDEVVWKYGILADVLSRWPLMLSSSSSPHGCFFWITPVAIRTIWTHWPPSKCLIEVDKIKRMFSVRGNVNYNQQYRTNWDVTCISNYCQINEQFIIVKESMI